MGGGGQQQSPKNPLKLSWWGGEGRAIPILGSLFWMRGCFALWKNEKKTTVPDGAPRDSIKGRPIIRSRVDKTGLIFLLLGYAFKAGFDRQDFNHL